MALTFDDITAMALRLPGVETGTSYGTPALKVGKALLARLREDGATMVLKVEPMERELLLDTAPGTFFLTDHYRAYPLVLVDLATVDADRLEGLIERAWRSIAPRRLLKLRPAEPA